MVHNYPFPKVIWFLWLQGIDDAPIIVQTCYTSWIKNNPGWQVILLDDHNLHNYTVPQQGKFTKQAFSDILRVNLLADNGGIWVDATCFCTRPLETWINDYMTTGFFAFDRPGEDRMLSSWFMACSKGNYMIRAYQKAVNSYWHYSGALTLIENSGWKFLNRRLTRRGTQVWFNIFVTKILRVHPYFWFHYLFEKIYLGDEKVREMWDATPKMSADIPHILYFAGLLSPLDEKIKEAIDSKIAPVYKLTWKYDAAELKKGTIIDYLLNSGEYN